MSTNQAMPFLMPTDKESIQQIQSAVKEASNALFRIQAERELMKEIAAVIKEDHNMPPADFNKMAKVYFKSEYQKQNDKHESFIEMYESVMAGIDPDLTV